MSVSTESASEKEETIKYFSSHRRRNLKIVAVVLVIAVSIALFYELVWVPRLTPSAAYPVVTVTGVVTINKAGETPTSVDFIAPTGAVSSTIVVSGGSYVLFLNNGETYSVTIHWQNSAVSNGTCSGGSLVLNVADDKHSFNPAC